MHKSISLTLFLVFLVASTMLVKYAQPVEDSDIWFQMAYGRYYIENNTLVPDHTIYSWTPSDNDQIYCAWIAQIVLYLVHKTGGLPALFFLRYLCLTVVIVLVWLIAKKNGVQWHPLTWFICLTGMLMSQSAILLKPEIFSFVFINLMVFFWWKMKCSKTGGHLYCYMFPTLIIIWVNSHGGIIFGLTFLGAILAGEVINYATSSRHMLAPHMRKHFISSLFLCGVAIFITPYGWEYPFQLINNFVLNSEEFARHAQTVMAYQSIFYPPAKHLHLVDYFVVSCCILVVLLWQRLRRLDIDWSAILPLLVFGVLYARILRTTYFFASVFTFSSIVFLSRSMLSGVLKRSVVVRSVQGVITVICIVIAGRAVYSTVCSPFFGFGINWCSPVEEARFIRSYLAEHRLGNDYNSGAYLLWALWPEAKVFIDARYFPYRSWYNEYEQLSNSGEIDGFIQKYPCDIWCMTYDFPQVTNFQKSTDWKLLHYGPSACIYALQGIELPPDFPRVAEDIDRTDIYQADKILRFALANGDIDVAQRIADSMKACSVCQNKKGILLEANNRVGLALMERSRFREAVEYYSRSLRADPESAKTHYYLANAFAQMGKRRDAINHYREALHKEPDLFPACNNLGNILMLEGRIDEAISYYNKAIQLNSEYQDAKTNIEVALEKKEGINTAIASLELLLETEPKQPGVLHKLAVLYCQRGDYQKAIVSLKQIIEEQPDNADAYYNIACVHAKQGNIDESFEWVRKSLEKGFDNRALLESDRDLDSIRHTNEFKGLVNMMEVPVSKE